MMVSFMRQGIKKTKHKEVVVVVVVTATNVI